MDENDLLLLGTRIPAGRTKASANFKADEDVMLAQAYVSVTTNAAVGTDQDGNTFWEKIRENFVRRGGLATRTMISLKNRFNKVLQADVNKYVGILHTVYREFHSGWSLDDFATRAKTVFQLKTGRQFKHEVVHKVLSKLPKYEIDKTSIDSRVCLALSLLDADKAHDEERDAIGALAPAGITGVSLDVLLTAGDNNSDGNETPLSASGRRALIDLTMTPRSSDNAAAGVPRIEIGGGIPRPTIGKKKAKRLAASQAASAKNARRGQGPNTGVVVEKQPSITITQESLKRLAAAAEAKNRLLQDQHRLQQDQHRLQQDQAAHVQCFHVKSKFR